MGPAGTVHMPLRDWARFVRPFLSPNEDSPGFLKAASLTRLLSPQVSDAEMGAEIALGWLIAKREWAKVRGGAGTVFNHAGSNTMWFCSIWGAPEAGFATLQASNAGPNVAGGPVDAAAGVMIDRFGKL
jgi:CubicO group peptidase (beta-lactamase class C family)